MSERVDLGFVAEDVKRQRELAQKALEEAKRIDIELQNPNIDAARKADLEESKQKWLSMARSLAENVVTTSAAASITISNVQQKK